MRILRRSRPLLLSLAIAVGLLVQAKTADAGETRDIIVAGGCFWCVEADFERVRGVKEAVSGYTGGTVANPTYKQVTRGGTGHYEAVQIHYNPGQGSLDRVLFRFFRSVDPLDAGGQFCDRGNSYRTAIFVSDTAQKAAAEKAKAEAQAKLGATVVTPILNAGAFYPAEAYHQDYYKGRDLVITRRGPKSMKEAYKFYRTACGRDARLRQLWGSEAVFSG